MIYAPTIVKRKMYENLILHLRTMLLLPLLLAELLTGYKCYDDME